MEETNAGKYLLRIVGIVIAFIVGLMVVLPRYNLYRQDLKGQANLRQQEWEKKITIEEAKALQESATLKAQAEVERAKWVAEANEIIGGSLKGNDEYLRYLYIDSLDTTTNQIIYIPTEAGLPILEATRVN